jgi:hypothetical protein
VNRILLPFLMVLTPTACSSNGRVASIEDRNQAAKGAEVTQGATAEIPPASAAAENKGVQTTSLPCMVGVVLSAFFCNIEECRGGGTYLAICPLQRGTASRRVPPPHHQASMRNLAAS